MMTSPPKPLPSDVSVEGERARLIHLKTDPFLTRAEAPIKDAIGAALEALDRDPHELETAVRIRTRVERAMADWTMPMFLVLGAVLPVAAILLFLAHQVFSDDLLQPFDFSLWSLERVALLGAFGGFVSVLLRIPDFMQLSGAQAVTQLLAGVFRPVIGAGFACFVYFVLQSGLVNTAFSMSKDPVVSTSFYFAVCTLAGFSERLAPSIASNTVGLLGGSSTAS